MIVGRVVGSGRSWACRTMLQPVQIVQAVFRLPQNIAFQSGQEGFSCKARDGRRAEAYVCSTLKRVG